MTVKAMIKDETTQERTRKASALCYSKKFPANVLFLLCKKEAPRAHFN